MKKILLGSIVLLGASFSADAGLVYRGIYSYDPSVSTIYCEGQSSICGELFNNGGKCTFIDCNNHTWNVLCSASQAEELLGDGKPVPVSDAEGGGTNSAPQEN